LGEEGFFGDFEISGEKRVFNDIPDMGCYEFTYPRGIVISIK
jgi:hypothetical protein